MTLTGVVLVVVIAFVVLVVANVVVDWIDYVLGEEGDE